MRRLVGYLGVALGVFGVVVCVAATVGAWTVYSHASRQTATFYRAVSQAVDQVEVRLNKTQLGIETVEKMVASFRADISEKLAAQVFDRLPFESRAESIAVRLQRVEDGLEFVASLLQKVGAVENIPHSFGKKADTAKLEQLIAEVGELQKRATEMSATFEDIRRQVAAAAGKEQLAEVIDRAMGKTLPVMQTTRVMNDRLLRLSGRVADAKAAFSRSESAVLRDLWWATWGLTFTLGLMAPSQVALCVMAWRFARRRRA